MRLRKRMMRVANKDGFAISFNVSYEDGRKKVDKSIGESRELNQFILPCVEGELSVRRAINIDGEEVKVVICKPSGVSTPHSFYVNTEDLVGFTQKQAEAINIGDVIDEYNFLIKKEKA